MRLDARGDISRRRSAHSPQRRRWRRRSAQPAVRCWLALAAYWRRRSAQPAVRRWPAPAAAALAATLGPARSGVRRWRRRSVSPSPPAVAGSEARPSPQSAALAATLGAARRRPPWPAPASVALACMAPAATLGAAILCPPSLPRWRATTLGTPATAALAATLGAGSSLSPSLACARSGAGAASRRRSESPSPPAAAAATLGPARDCGAGGNAPRTSSLLPSLWPAPAAAALAATLGAARRRSPWPAPAAAALARRRSVSPSPPAAAAATLGPARDCGAGGDVSATLSSSPSPSRPRLHSGGGGARPSSRLRHRRRLGGLPARPPRPAPAALHGAGSNARRVSSPVLPPVLPSVCAAPCLSCHLYCSASCSALCLCCPLLLCSVSCFSGYCVVGCIQDTRAAALLSPAPWLAAPAPAVPGTDDLVGCDGCRRPCITSPVAGGARPGCPRTNGFMTGLTGLPPMRAPRARPLADAAPAPAVPGRTTWLAAGCRAADPALAPAPWLTRRPPRLSQYERLELVMRLFLRALQRLLLGLLSQSHEPPPNRGHAWQLRPTGASRRAHARRPAAHQTKAK